jgi:hypothetical protein
MSPKKRKPAHATKQGKFICEACSNQAVLAWEREHRAG